MAKIFKISGYYIDPNGDWDESDLQTELEERFDLIDQHIKVESKDIGEWEDNNPLNKYDCPVEECEKYFSKIVLNNDGRIKTDKLCLDCAITEECNTSHGCKNGCSRYTDNFECLCVNIKEGEVCKDYRPR